MLTQYQCLVNGQRKILNIDPLDKACIKFYGSLQNV